ncbi:MAG: GNAT family N-acetyltransferase [Clostridia bacterium]|nr:GNAT family N-acetyltransferase [Clostridia bacterium]
MEVRYIKENEAADFQKVSAVSFIWEFNAEVDNTVNCPVLAAFDNGRLIAGTEACEFKVNYCGNLLDTVVVDGVCSLPEYRRKGGVRAVFDKISELAEEKGWVLGFLSPFSISYYEKFGYANLNRMFSVRVPFESLRHIPRNNDVILYTGEHYEEISELHNKCAAKENLIAIRDNEKDFCATPYESADYTYFRRDANGVADGYVRFTVKRPDEVSVEDLFVLTPEALYGLIGFLRNYDGIAKSLVVGKQYQGSAFACLADRADKAAYEYGGAMAGRIYNLKKLLQSNVYPKKYGKFRLLSTDDIQRNAGVFEVEYENGKAVVTQTEGGEYDISLTAAAAARLMLAGEGHTAQTAVYIDGVKINGNADDFFRAFPHRPTRFVDSTRYK